MTRGADEEAIGIAGSWDTNNQETPLCEPYWSPIPVCNSVVAGEAGSSRQGWRRLGWRLAVIKVAWVPVVIECHVALAVVSKPPFYSALLCCSSLRFCASTSGKHGLVVLGAWSYHVVLRCHCSGLAPLADAHRWQLLACLKSPLADHHGARSANPSCWKGWPLSCGFSCDLAMDDRLLKEWQYGYGFCGTVD